MMEIERYNERDMRASPAPPVLLPLTVSLSSLCPRALCVSRRLGRGKTESAQGGDGNEKKKHDRGSRLFCLPIFHRSLIYLIYIIFLNTQREPLQRREHSLCSCIMQICCCRSFYRPQPANHCISLFSCFVCVSVFASVC